MTALYILYVCMRETSIISIQNDTKNNTKEMSVVYTFFFYLCHVIHQLHDESRQQACRETSTSASSWGGCCWCGHTSSSCSWQPQGLVQRSTCKKRDNNDQCLSQDLETGCLKLAVVKLLGVHIFKGDHNILIFQP